MGHAHISAMALLALYHTYLVVTFIGTYHFDNRGGSVADYNSTGRGLMIISHHAHTGVSLANKLPWLRLVLLT